MTSRPRFRAPRRLPSEADVSAALRGQAVPGLGGAHLLASEVRALTEDAPAPSPALQQLLRNGFDPAAVRLAAMTTSAVPRSLPARRAGLLTRVAGASLLVKLASGAGVAVVGLTAAASTGHLPEVVQDGVADLVDAVTPSGPAAPGTPLPLPAATPTAVPTGVPAAVPPADVQLPQPVPTASRPAAGGPVTPPRPADPPSAAPAVRPSTPPSVRPSARPTPTSASVRPEERPGGRPSPSTGGAPEQQPTPPPEERPTPSATEDRRSALQPAPAAPAEPGRP